MGPSHTCRVPQRRSDVAVPCDRTTSIRCPRDSETDYTWSMAFHEVNVIARPLIALAARLFEQALSAQADALTAYLHGLPDGEPLPRL